MSKLLAPASRRRGLAAAQLLTDWPTIVGPSIAARCQPVKLTADRRDEGGTLHLHVAGTAALELQHNEPQLRERINQYFGHPAVARLRLIRAPLARPRSRKPKPKAVLDSAARAEIERVVGPVVDERLRAALAGLGSAIRAESAPAGAGTSSLQPDPIRHYAGGHRQ